MIDYYIATALENVAQHRELQDLLNRMCDCRLTYDWTRHGSVQKLGQKAIEQTAKNEISGVLAADVVLVLLPGGRGTHTELGIAIGQRRTIFILGTEEDFNPTEGRTCAFYYAPHVHRVTGGNKELVIAFRDWMIDNRFSSVLVGMRHD